MKEVCTVILCLANAAVVCSWRNMHLPLRSHQQIAEKEGNDTLDKRIQFAAISSESAARHLQGCSRDCLAGDDNEVKITKAVCVKLQENFQKPIWQRQIIKIESFSTSRRALARGKNQLTMAGSSYGPPK
ncbi:hypothetical protein Y1Q_0022399 [Alligator mississippiensis]|uniref:Secreted protein n=1 Tax=Alligator mississippiensis TaxID=8496 RepID=A0A151N094_ALLMI|nr:hypothetical protein Y1Q_0022399 [Alligator mississippiensis]